MIKGRAPQCTSHSTSASTVRLLIITERGRDRDYRAASIRMLNRGDEKIRYSLIPTLYRDASNYKATGRLLVEGVISSSHRARLSAALDDGTGYCPDQLGLPHTGESMKGFPGEDDHGWNEMDPNRIEAIDLDPEDPEALAKYVDRNGGPMPIEIGTDAEEFVVLIESVAAAGWFPENPC